jgi:ATP-dependent DNA helicase DinG
MPVIEARSELTRKKGQDPFSKLLLPEAVIRFKQGFGRLLRTRKDKGVFILLDDRVVTKGYGSNFLRSLPKRSHVRGNREQVLEKLSEFFERGSA